MTMPWRPIVAALSSNARHGVGGQGRSQPTPFVTISRQVGTGASPAPRLAERLNERRQGDEPQWQSLDREIIEMIARDHNISRSLLESLETDSQTWIQTIIGGITSTGSSEVALFNRVAQTILTLAKVGHVILVGRGGVFVTHGMPGGMHVLLVAPWSYRVEQIGQERGLKRQDAERVLQELDANQQDFYRRHFPSYRHGPESFTITLNVGQLSHERMVEALLPLIEELRAARV